jgi:hypothetical protein
MSIGDLPMRRIREWGPLGRHRFVVIILAGILEPQFNVLSLSLDQVGCSHLLGEQWILFI